MIKIYNWQRYRSQKIYGVKLLYPLNKNFRKRFVTFLNIHEIIRFLEGFKNYSIRLQVEIY